MHEPTRAKVNGHVPRNSYAEQQVRPIAPFTRRSMANPDSTHEDLRIQEPLPVRSSERKKHTGEGSRPRIPQAHEHRTRKPLSVTPPCPCLHVARH